MAAGVIRGFGSTDQLTKTDGASPLSTVGLTMFAVALLAGAGDRYGSHAAPDPLYLLPERGFLGAGNKDQ